MISLLLKGPKKKQISLIGKPTVFCINTVLLDYYLAKVWLPIFTVTGRDLIQLL